MSEKNKQIPREGRPDFITGVDSIITPKELEALVDANPGVVDKQVDNLLRKGLDEVKNNPKPNGGHIDNHGTSPDFTG